MSYIGEDIKKLGFGLMRLPMIGEDVDIEQTKQMVDIFMKNGFTYFDTAYVYMNGKSERALKEAVVDRYPRESFQAATKLPLYALKSKDDMEAIFQESCDRAGVDYFDFYLLHNIHQGVRDTVEKLDCFGYLKELKAQGRIKHMGFSFHDNAEFLDEMLTAHPEADFVQLQINYADWDSNSIQSGKCYEVARKHNKPIIIMEPVKGGSLAALTPEIREVFLSANPDRSLASWAMRFAASLDGIITVLSGMSDLQQMEDNCISIADFQPFSAEEDAVIEKAVSMFKEIPIIPCTYCKYCIDDCPQNINIPEIFDTQNAYTLYNNFATNHRHYGFVVNGRGKASDCISCGVCESRCPQHIKIPQRLVEAAELFEGTGK